MGNVLYVDGGLAIIFVLIPGRYPLAGERGLDIMSCAWKMLGIVRSMGCSWYKDINTRRAVRNKDGDDNADNCLLQ